MPPLHSTSDVEVGHGLTATQREELEPGHGHRTRRQEHLLTCASQRVGPLTTDLERAHRAGDLLDGATQTRDDCPDLLLVHRGCVETVRGRALSVVGAGGHSEPHRAPVDLGFQREMPEQLSGALHAADEHSRGHRIQGACVPDPAGAQQPAQPGDDVVRSHPGGLVHHHQTAQGQPGVHLTVERIRRPRVRWAHVPAGSSSANPRQVRATKPCNASVIDALTRVPPRCR